MSNHAIDLYGVQKMVRGLAKHQGLNLVYKDLGDHPPYTDSKNIYVNPPSPRFTPEELMLWKYTVYHELGHNIPEMRDSWEVLKEKQISAKSFFGSVLNILEDYRQERYKIYEYHGKRKVLSKGRKIFLRKQLERWREPRDKHDACVMAMFCFDAHGRESWMPDLTGMGNQYYQRSNEEIQGYTDKLKAGDYLQIMDSSPTAWEEYELAKRIIEEVFELDPEEEEQKAQRTKKGGNGNGSGDGEQSEGQDSEVPWEDLMFHSHDLLKPSYSKLVIDYSTYDIAGDYKPYNLSEIDVVRKDRLNNPDTFYDMYPVKGTLSASVLRLLKIYSRARYEYGKKKGNLHNKNLYRLMNRDSSSFRVFKQKKTTDILDTAVSVLIDFSGSMGGEKMQHAISAGLMLNNAISTLGIPLEILGFTERRSGVFYELKPFGTKISEQNLSSRCASAAKHGMGYNADPDAVLFAYSRLAQQSNKRKILIVLSDGQPASGNEGDIRSFLKKTVKDIESKGVSVYSIGIQSEAVRQYYKNHAVLRDPRDLEKTLLSVVKDHIIQY